VDQAFFDRITVKGRDVVEVRHVEPFASSSALGGGRVSDNALLVEMTGFEPATSWLQTRRSSD
jgi:hypothetical protein